MMLWILLTAMTLVAAIGLTLPLARRRGAPRGGAGSVEVLKDQLRDIDVQAADGTLPAPDAQGLRTEVARRILAEGPNPPMPARSLGDRARLGLGVALVVALAGSATLLYLRVGRPDLAGVSPTPTPTATAPGSGDIAALIAPLEAKMRQAPGDPVGWRMLGWAYMQTGRYGEAANAYGKASALAPTAAEFPSAQGEALTQAAGGQVTPAARAAFQRALVLDGGDPRARYFLAMANDQGGDHAGAMAQWIALIKSAPPGAPWVADVRASVERIGRRNGQDIAAQLPAAPAPTAGDQQVMINAMVERLAARLKANPKDADGWVQLMRARMVLGQSAAAAAALRDALAAYADRPTQQAVFHAAARDLRIPGA